jgi:ABC-2 type transport system ATP-binding protein
MDLAVSVRGLRKDSGTVQAVRGVDFDVHSGEVLALLGRNGDGKTTIVEILEGYQCATSGEVAVLGIDPRHERRRCSKGPGSSCKRRRSSSS